MQETYKKAEGSETAVIVTTAIERIETLDMLLQQRESRLNDNLATTAEIDRLDEKIQLFRDLGVKTQAEIDAENETVDEPLPTE